MIAAAEILEQAEAQHQKDTGYPNHTVKGIVKSLRHGSLSAAQAEWYCDGDKVRFHTKLGQAVIQVLGCRLHHQHDCKNWICRKINDR